MIFELVNSGRESRGPIRLRECFERGCLGVADQTECFGTALCRTMVSTQARALPSLNSRNSTKCAQACILHDILRIGRIAGEPARQPINAYANCIDRNERQRTDQDSVVIRTIPDRDDVIGRWRSPAFERE